MEKKWNDSKINELCDIVRKTSFAIHCYHRCGHLEKIYENVFPEGQMQERIVNIFNYINKYSFTFLKDLYDNIDPRDFTHKFVEIG